jgi:aminoglycoside phosphotransferase (APT) family kinase protein
MAPPPASASALGPPPAALALVPGLEQGGSPQFLRRLLGGQVNETWHIATGVGQFTLRLDGPLARRPGVDRERELRLHTVAAAAGLAPRIVRAAPEAQALVCEFLAGRSWSDRDFQDARSLARLGERLATLHALAPPPQPRMPFDPHALAARYLEQARSLGASDSAAPGTDTVLQQLRQAMATIEAASVPPGIVHGDLPHGNVLENAQLWLLDWEYAQFADPIYDIACILAQVPLAGRLQRRLLAAAGLGRPQDVARLPAAVHVYRVLTWAWRLARAESCAAPTLG